MRSLLERVTFVLEHHGRKHRLGEDYAEKAVNGWTNFELLQNISDALEDVLEDARDEHRPVFDTRPLRDVT